MSACDSYDFCLSIGVPRDRDSIVLLYVRTRGMHMSILSLKWCMSGV